MSNFWMKQVGTESTNKLMQYDVVPMEEKYSDVYDLMMLPEYTKFFYDTVDEQKSFESKKESFSKGLSSQYSGTGAVALYKGKPVAFCIGVTTKHFIMIATAPAHTGNGLGTLLLELTLRKYQLGHISTATAVTKKSNLPMQRILQRYGTLTDEDLGDDSYTYELITETTRNLTPYNDCLAKMSLPK